MSLERNQKLRRRKSAVNGQSKRSAGTNREGEGPPEPPLCHQLRQVASLGKNRLTPCGCPSEGFEFVEGQWRLRRTFALPFANPCGSGGSSPSRLQTHAAQGDLRPPDCKPMRLRGTFALPIANPSGSGGPAPSRWRTQGLRRTFALPVAIRTWSRHTCRADDRILHCYNTGTCRNGCSRIRVRGAGS